MISHGRAGGSYRTAVRSWRPARGAVHQALPEVSQTKAQSVYPLYTVTYQVKVQNDGPTTRTFALEAVESAEQDWTIVYRAGATDISFAMRSATGYPTPSLAPGASQILTVEMQPGLSVPAFSTKSVTLNAYLDDRASVVRDAVKIVSTCWSTLQPDLMIRRAVDGSFAGEGFFNSTGAGQTKLLDVEAGQTATYYVQLKNYGNATNRIGLTGPGGGGGWTVNYSGGWPYFDVNSANYVRVANAPALRPTNLTAEAWVNFTSVPGGDLHVLAKTLGGGGDNSYVVWYAGGQLRAYCSGGPALGYGWSPSLGRWYHVAYVYDDASNAQTLYLDGQVVASGATSASISYDTHPLLLGGDYSNENPYGFFPGKLADVRLWSVPRTQAGIQADMKRRLTGAEPGLAGYWRLDEGAGTVARDATANANDGQVVNAPAWGVYDEPSTNGFDITSEIAQAGGWTNIVLPPKATYSLILQVSPSFGVPASSVKAVAITATSVNDPTKQDVVKALTTVLNQGPPRLLPLLFDASGFTFLLQAEPGWNYVIQASADLMNWVGVDTNRPGTNSVLYVDPAARTEGHRFYRALQQP